MPDKSVTLKNDFIKEVNEKASASKLKGFTLNTDNIKTELAQINTVIGEYKTTLDSGAAPDPKGLYQEFVEKLKVAGDDKVIEEIKNQIDAWRAGNSNQ